MPSVLVTGAGRGIGLAITEHMSAKSRYLLDNASRVQKFAVAMTPTAVNDALLAFATTSK